MITVTKDQYQSWRDSDVTKRFMAEIEQDLDACKEQQIFGTTEEIVEQAHERNASMELLNNVLEWKPVELEENEND